MPNGSGFHRMKDRFDRPPVLVVGGHQALMDLSNSMIYAGPEDFQELQVREAVLGTTEGIPQVIIKLDEVEALFPNFLVLAS